MAVAVETLPMHDIGALKSQVTRPNQDETAIRMCRPTSSHLTGE
jgi:hypothetical protein